MSFADVEMKIIQWGEARGIVQNSSPKAQWHKTVEEVEELRDAIKAGDREAMKDAYGDILVTLIMGCACADLDLVDCLKLAYNQIKERTGTMRSDGIFYKDK